MRIEIGRALRAGFDGLGRHPVLLPGAIVAAGILASLGQELMQSIGGAIAGAGLPGLVVGVGVAFGGALAMNSYFALGILAVSLAVSRGQGATIGLLSDGGRVWVQGLIVYTAQVLGLWLMSAPLVVGVLLFGGLGLLLAPILLVPPIWFWLAVSQAQYLVLDRDLSAIEALRGSFELTRGHRLSLFLIHACCGGLLVALAAGCAGFGFVLQSPLTTVVAGLGLFLGVAAIGSVLLVALADTYDRLLRATDPKSAEPSELRVA